MERSFGLGRLLAIDNIDDRREIEIQLGKLEPSQRIELLQWCCSVVRERTGMQIGVGQSLGLVPEIKLDIMFLITNYPAITLAEVLTEIERRASLKRTP